MIHWNQYGSKRSLINRKVALKLCIIAIGRIMRRISYNLIIRSFDQSFITLTVIGSVDLLDLKLLKIGILSGWNHFQLWLLPLRFDFGDTQLIISTPIFKNLMPILFFRKNKITSWFHIIGFELDTKALYSFPSIVQK